MNQIIVSALILLLLLVTVHRANYHSRDSNVSNSFLNFLFLGLISILFLTLFNQIFEPPHNLLGVGLFSPGSLLTRGITIPSSFETRRLIEPSALLFIIALGSYGHILRKKSARLMLQFALFGMISILAIEGNYLFKQTALEQTAIRLNPSPIILWLIVLSLLNLAFLFELSLKSPFRLRHQTHHLSSLLILPFLLWIVLVSKTLLFDSNNDDESKNPFRLATHYYFWFPENWGAGYAGRKDPDQYNTPVLGEYSSNKPEIISSHLKEMEQAGINLVLLDWWPRIPHLKDRAVKVSEALREHPNMHFSAHLETLEIAEDGSRDIIIMKSKEILVLSLFMEHLAKRLFSHPQYLRIQDRPVVFLYASRHLIGDTRDILLRVRRHVKEKTGYDPYFIGDEVFYNVPELGSDGTAKLLPKLIPNWERIRAFDAITLYNPYNPDAPYGDQEDPLKYFVNETESLYRRYRSIAETAGVPFIPTVIPGYDDRVLRPKINSFPLERESSTGDYLLDLLLDISESSLSNSSPRMTIITSWNEWNEGTQIEPGEKSLDNETDKKELKILKSRFMKRTNARKQHDPS